MIFEDSAAATIEAKTLSDLVNALNKAYTAAEEIYANQMKISLSELRLLRLFTDTSTIAVDTLVRLMDITAGRITHILTALEDAGYIERQQEKEDRRKIVVHVTPNTIGRLQEINDYFVAVHSSVLTAIDPDNKKLLIDTISSITSKIREGNVAFFKENTERKLTEDKPLRRRGSIRTKKYLGK